MQTESVQSATNTIEVLPAIDEQIKAGIILEITASLEKAGKSVDSIAVELCAELKYWMDYHAALLHALGDDRNELNANEYHARYLRYARMCLSAFKQMGIGVPKGETFTVKPLSERFSRKKTKNPPTTPPSPQPALKIYTGVLSKLPDVRNKPRSTGNRNVIANVRHRRAALIERLGGKCVLCGTTDRLEFDHIHGATWKLDSFNSRDRMKMYEQDADAGLLRILCRSCNAKDGRNKRFGKGRWKQNENQNE